MWRRQKPAAPSHALMVVVVFMVFPSILLMAAIFSGSMPMPSPESINPRNLTSFAMRVHFSADSETPLDARRSHTNSKRSRHSSKVCPHIRMSSIYTVQAVCRIPARISCTSCMRYPGAHANPNGSRLYSYLPSGVTNAVTCLDPSSAISRELKADARSKAQNHFGGPERSGGACGGLFHSGIGSTVGVAFPGRSGNAEWLCVPVAFGAASSPPLPSRVSPLDSACAPRSGCAFAGVVASRWPAAGLGG